MPLILVILLFLPAVLFGQNLQTERIEQQKRLQKLRQEISEVEANLEKSGAEERKLADKLADLDKKLSLRKSLLRELEKDRRLTERELKKSQSQLRKLRGDISGLDQNISVLIDDIVRLKEVICDRALYAYKYLKRHEAGFVLAADNFNQALVRKKYFRTVAGRDKQNLEDLREKKSLLAENRSMKVSTEATLISAERKMQGRLRYKRELIDESRNEERKLQSEKRQKKTLLNNLKNDQAALRKELEAKKAAASAIEQMIANLLTKVKEAKDVARIFPDLDVKRLKGKMEWPVAGKVISKFGRHMNPQLKTWTENTGIDIAAKSGADVQVVASGKITVVTWLRGYGTTMIVNHPGGYYTVYSHLDEVLANPGSYVTGGTVIARAGDSGSLGGSKLHFEIWEKKTKHDPENWLKKRS